VSLPQTVRIREIQEDARAIRTIVLDAQVPGAEPGQFIMLWLPGLDEKPMSIASPAPLTITVDRVGPFTTVLHQRKVGDWVGWRGPFGHGFTLHRDRPALMVSGGCGVGPIRFLAARAADSAIPTTVALGARSAPDLPHLGQLRATGADLLLATDDGSRGYHGLVTDAIGELPAPELEACTIYACGPEGMLVALHRICRDRGIPGQLSVERYMKCGFGICGQCAMDGHLVCQDGPVFSAEQLDGLRDFGHAHRTATGRRLPNR
jgi:dihydroorotate dehydrogenase electron transfer subunit